MHELFESVAIPHQPMAPDEVNKLLAEAAITGSQVLFMENAGHTNAKGIVLESAGGNAIKFRGKFQEANSVNKNKRMYTYDILNKNLDRLIETVKQRGLTGELDHPTDSIIHFDKASHVITNLWWEGNILMGEGEILPTPHGQILKNLIDRNVRVGISSRGVGNGTTNEDGVLVIGESYKLITFDAVADPSTFAAYQKVVTSKKGEAVESQPITADTPDESCGSKVKNEVAGIHSNNGNALVAYIGQVIRNHVHNIKREKFQSREV